MLPLGTKVCKQSSLLAIEKDTHFRVGVFFYTLVPSAGIEPAFLP